MAKLWNRMLSQNGGAQTSLLKKNGPTSDGFQDRDDDDSSSLSGPRKGPPRTISKKKFVAKRLFRKKTTVGGDDDGYESDASGGSDGSTRSTSSSFLKYQGRAKWRSFLSGKTVVQRGNDGSEQPVENNTSKWPIFSQIYKRQNQLLAKGQAGEDGKDGSSDDDDDDSVFSTDSLEEEPVMAPPAPTFEKMTDEAPATPPATTKTSSPDSSPVTTQDSGISTCERSEKQIKMLPAIFPAVAPSKTRSTDSSTSSKGDLALNTLSTSSSHEYPMQAPTYSGSAKEIKDDIEAPKPEEESVEPAKLSRKKSKRSKQPKSHQTGDMLTPLSIPLTICYSLRSAIGDGSARQRNSHSLMERRSLRPNGSHLDVSHWSHRGKRSYMEDRFVIEHIGNRSKVGPPITWLGVFDGHGGAAASQFCSDWLSSYVRKNDFFPEQLPLAMECAFTKLDNDFVSSGNLDGSTACACAVIGSEKVICCNAGDSRAIIVKRDGSVVALSEDHKPGRNDETKRINDLGGRVIYWGRWRVEGVLAVSRSIGDAKLKPYVTAQPDIVEHEIGEDDMFLVIASDGVWDTMTSDLVAKFVLVNTCKIVNKSLQVDNTLLRWIARQISKRARENGSSDNISCIVCNLKSKLG